jgi:hypothetical protein
MARLKSLGQGQHRGFFLSCCLRSNYGSNRAATASEQPGGGQGQHRSLFLYYCLRFNLRLLPYFDRIKTVKTKSNYGSITAPLKSLGQGQHRGFFLSCRLR